MKVSEAKNNGQWEKAYSSSIEEPVPEDFLKELKKNKTALTNFFNYSLSIRNRYIQRIIRAKRPETRKKRILETVYFSEKNIKGESELYSLVEFVREDGKKVRNDASYDNQ